MGVVSFFEDIQKRYEDCVRDNFEKRNIDSIDADSLAHQLRELRRIRFQTSAAIIRLKHYIKLASDPRVELAEDSDHLRDLNQRLSQENSCLKNNTELTSQHLKTPKALLGKRFVNRDIALKSLRFELQSTRQKLAMAPKKSAGLKKLAEAQRENVELKQLAEAQANVLAQADEKIARLNFELNALHEKSTKMEIESRSLRQDLDARDRTLAEIRSYKANPEAFYQSYKGKGENGKR